MGFLSDISSVVSNIASTVATSLTGSPLLGQMAGNFVSSVLNDSGTSGNTPFDNVFNGAWGNGFLNAVNG